MPSKCIQFSFSDDDSWEEIGMMPSQFILWNGVWPCLHLIQFIIAFMQE